MHPINKLLSKFSLKLVRLPPEKIPEKIFDDKIMINIGSGNWSCSGWTNLDFPSDHYKEAQKRHKIIPYNIREDNIPFDDNSVDVIYTSHVIEHIENEYIQRMFAECFRTLKKDRIIRIACPDAEFLYEISKHKTDYWVWRWRKGLSSLKKYYITTGNIPRNVDFLVREIATPKLLYFRKNQTDYLHNFQSLDMLDFFEYLTGDLKYCGETPGDHINWWTFAKVKNMLNEAGFHSVIHSKWSASCSAEMKNMSYFDITDPIMSLYVEAIK